MVPIGTRPILWHNMRYFAHFGHKDFVLCLGYKAEVIKEILPPLRRDDLERLRPRGRAGRGRSSAPTSTTGASRSRRPGWNSNIGQRLTAVRKFVDDAPMFLANYGDNLTDAPMDELVRRLAKRARRWRHSSRSGPTYTFHIVRVPAVMGW